MFRIAEYLLFFFFEEASLESVVHPGDSVLRKEKE
jgi:hypothetical protein